MRTPKAPARLTGEALAEWKRLAAGLNLQPEDVETFAEYCLIHADCVLIAEQVSQLPSRTLAGSKTGAPYTHPLINELNTSRGLRLKYSQRFGLDPASRSKIVGAMSDNDGIDPKWKGIIDDS